MSEYHPCKWPLSVDSPGKLREAIGECGVPQGGSRLAIARSVYPLLTCPNEAVVNHEKMALAVEFSKDDREPVQELLRQVSEAIHNKMAVVPKDQIWVWRILPEFSEHEVLRYRAPDGTEVDRITYRGNLDDLAAEQTGKVLVQFYARFGRAPLDV